MARTCFRILKTPGLDRQLMVKTLARPTMRVTLGPDIRPLEPTQVSDGYEKAYNSRTLKEADRGLPVQSKLIR